MTRIALTVRSGEVTAASAILTGERQEDGLMLLFSGRLHYRSDLARLTQQPSGASDGSLVIAAYRRFAGEGFARLEGDFALVLLDNTRRCIFALRDPMGAVPLFWRRGRDTFMIADALASLEAGGMQVAPSYIADILLMASPNPDDLATSPHQGIERIRPGCLAEFDFSGTLRATRDIAQWPARIRAVQRPDAESFRAVLEAAVEERAVGRLAAHVSGGMDSTAVAMIAALPRRPVLGLSLVYDRIGELKSEQVYIDAIRRDGLSLARIAADELLDFGAFGAVAPHEEPSPWLFRAGQDIAMIEAAKEAGCTTILTGIGADETLAVVPIEIADHLRRGRLRQAHAIASAWAGAHGTAAWRFIQTFGLDPLLAPMSGWFAMRQRRWQPAPWLDRDFVRAVDWPGRAREHAGRFHGEAASRLEAQLIANIRNSSGDWPGVALARPMGLELAHPFRDPRVLALGAAARLAMAPDPFRPKPLLADAMRGLLPDAILDRRGKARFDAIHYQGLTRHRNMLIAMVKSAPPAIDAWFNRDALCAAVRDAALGYRRLDALHGLAASLAVVKWMALRGA